jgi:peptidyl-prolyl cis-trans isomerase C
MSFRTHLAASALFCGLLVPAGPAFAQKGGPAPSKPAAPKARVLASVDGRKITEADLARAFRVQQVPEDQQTELRRDFLEKLIDARLVERFLQEKKISAPKALLDRQLADLMALAAKAGTDAEGVLNRHGYSQETLKEELAFRLAWAHYVERTYPPEKLREYYIENKAEFDGTLVRARQIFLKVDLADMASVKQGLARLAEIRRQVEAEEMSFEQAARNHSEAPSRDQGGDVGWFPARGKMPAEFARRAFALKTGECSEPFQTRFGLHLLQVVDRMPGDLSLEDARDEVLAQVSRELWSQTTAVLRATARIERMD